MSSLYLAGEHGNALTNALSVTSTSADALFPLADLYAGRPSSPFRFNANAADLVITADISRVADGGFEVGALTDWTEVITGTGATSQDLVVFKYGAGSLECDGGAAGTAERYQDIVVRAGAWMSFDFWMYGGGGVTARARLENLDTGLFLGPAATWGAAADVATEAGAAWAETALAFQVESLSACGGKPLVTLRLHFYNNNNGPAYFDGVELYPRINFASIHGHNLSPVVTAELRSSNDGFVGVDDLAATFTIGRPSFFTYLATPLYRSGWKLKLSGTNVETPYHGEMVLGYAESLDEAPRYGMKVEHEYPQVRMETAARDAHVLALSRDPVRPVKLSFRQRTDARWEELRDELWRRGYGGEVPLVIVPDSSKGDVIHGRTDGRLDVTHGDTVYTSSLWITEDGFPVVGL